jgi:hypothetical protein
MRIEVDLQTLGPTAWRKAKNDFIANIADLDYKRWSAEKLYREFGAANGMTIQVDNFKGTFPVITKIEFDDEQSLSWFILRWS